MIPNSLYSGQKKLKKKQRIQLGLLESVLQKRWKFQPDISNGAFVWADHAESDENLLLKTIAAKLCAV